MPSESPSSSPDNIDPRQNIALRYNDGPFNWDRLSSLRSLFGIMYHDQPDGGPALIGLPLPQAPTCRVIRPGLTTNPEELIHALLKAVAEEPAAFPTVESLEADLRKLGVVVRGVGHDLMGDISECKAFTAKLRRVKELEPLESTFYPHALVEALGKYASLYIIAVYVGGDGKYLTASDHRKTAGMSTAFNPKANEQQDAQMRDSLVDSLKRKITLRLLEPVIAHGGHYRPPVWRIMDQPLPPATTPAPAA